VETSVRAWKKKAAEAKDKIKDELTPDEDSHLPGSAGYRDKKGLPKGAMPGSRLRYVRPDGKEEER